MLVICVRMLKLTLHILSTRVDIASDMYIYFFTAYILASTQIFL